MILETYLDNTRWDTDKWLLQAINNLTFPDFSYSTAQRGQFTGRKIQQGKLRGFKFGLEWLIIADSSSDLATQRENFTGLLAEIVSSGVKTFKVKKANGVEVQVDVKGLKIAGDLKANEPFASAMLVELETESPFLVGQSLKDDTVNIFTGGGMAIPMAIPMSMAMGGTNDVTVTNEGNFDAYPVFTLYGVLENPSIANITTGKALNINYNLPTSSDYIVIDTYNRTAIAYPSGINIRNFVSGDFWTLAKGDNLLHLGSASYNASGHVVVEYRDTFIGL